MRHLFLTALLLLPLGCATTSQASMPEHAAKPDVAAAQFARIVALAGEWSGTFGEGESAGKGETSFRVTAGGSVVEETLFAGTPHEMVTMYHLDGGRLVLTHYCAARNQPRMVARSGEADRHSKTIRFDFASLGNKQSDADGHMHEAEMTIDGDRLKTAWTFYKDGKPAEVARFDLARKAPPTKQAGAMRPTLLGDEDIGLFDRILVARLSRSR